MVTTRVAFRTGMRKAAVDLLQAYAQSAGLSLQVYPTLPTSFAPPTAFVERINERDIVLEGITQRRRYVTVSIILLYRLFAENERGDAAVQLDSFLDSFNDWVLESFHEVDGTSLVNVSGIEDQPEYTISGARGAITYFAARITLEGYTAN
jgi:hypothetical protein